MAEDLGGMAELQQRTERRSEVSRGRRAPGPPRHPVEPGPIGGMKADPRAPAEQDAVTQSQPDPREPVRLEPGEPVNTMALRIRRPLDRWLTDTAHEINSTGWRTSKAELIEMMIWEEYGTSPPELKGRLTEFRRLAPRR